MSKPFLFVNKPCARGWQHCTPTRTLAQLLETPDGRSSYQLAGTTTTRSGPATRASYLPEAHLATDDLRFTFDFTQLTRTVPVCYVCDRPQGPDNCSSSLARNCEHGNIRKGRSATSQFTFRLRRSSCPPTYSLTGYIYQKNRGCSAVSNTKHIIPSIHQHGHRIDLKFTSGLEILTAETSASSIVLASPRSLD